MEAQQEQQQQQRRSYTEEFKREAVRLVSKDGQVGLPPLWRTLG